MKRLLSAMLAVLLLCCSVGTLPFSAASALPEDITQEDQNAVDDRYDSIEELEKQIKELEAQKKEITSQKHNVEDVLDNLTQQIKTTERKIVALKESIEESEDEIAALEANIADLDSNIESNLEKFKQRVRAMYISSHTSELEILLSSENYVDMLTKAEILRRIAEYDNKLINSLINDKTDVENKRTQVEDKKTELVAEQKDMIASNDKLDEMYKENDEYLDELKKDEKAYAASIAKAEKEKEEVLAEIEEILSKYESNLEYTGGEYAWPLPGFSKITSAYGKRSSGNHTGTDIAGRNAEGEKCLGYPIVSVADGVVIAVLDRGKKSYGKYLIIDHGSGRKSLYAHCNSISVKEGDRVTKGQTIAKAGSTGNSTGPHLHIELWIDDVRIDPMTVLKYPN